MPQTQGGDKQAMSVSEQCDKFAARSRAVAAGANVTWRTLLTGALLAAAVAFTQSVPAVEVAGVQFEDSARVADDQPPLTLNGAGVRSKFFVKVYAAALYLTEKASSADAVLALPGPKRVRMHFIHSEVSADKIQSGWTDGYKANHSEEELTALQPRIDQFNALFPTLKAGDVVDVDYIPGSGTAVRLNGETRGVVPGEDFYRATLKIWLGERPAHNGLKSGMLGEG